MVLGKAENQVLPSGAHRLVNKTDIQTNNPKQLDKCRDKGKEALGVVGAPKRGN